MSSRPRQRRANPPLSRLGISPLQYSSTSTSLPPLVTTSPRLSEQRDAERTVLEAQLATRVAAQRSSTDLARLLQLVTEAVDASQENEDITGGQDVFEETTRLVGAISARCPNVAQLLGGLLREARKVVQDELRKESENAERRQNHTRLSTTEVASDDESDLESEEERQCNEPYGSVRSPAAPPRQRFRTTLRSRRFPPTRVRNAEKIVRKTSYTPFSLQRRGAVANGELLLATDPSTDDDGGEQWSIVLFPRARPSLSREEIDAFMQWATITLARPQCETDGRTNLSARFLDRLAVRELVGYELTRLIFDKCPTTARFLHGLLVEFQQLATRSLASVEKDAQVLEQRHQNAQRELQKLTVRREAVESSLAALQDTMRRRQQQLLTLRERGIRQRKKLNVMLAADQVVIRRVMSVFQHCVECADDMMTSTNDRAAPSFAVSPTIACYAEYTAVQELYDLVTTKYAMLPEVQLAHHECQDERKRKSDNLEILSEEGIECESTENRVIVFDVEAMSLAADEFKAALGRLGRLLTTKCPDSSVGWAPEDLWDQALFIPSPDDVKDIDRDVQRLCARVEAFILEDRHFHVTGLREGRCATIAIQTDMSTCGPGYLRGRQRANAFLSAQTVLTAGAPSLLPNVDVESPIKKKGQQSMHNATKGTIAARRHQRESSADMNANTDVITSSGQLLHHRIGEVPPATAARMSMLRESNDELFREFLPEGLQEFVPCIPVDYEPRQLSLAVVHAVISYTFNEMFSLVQQDNLHHMNGGRLGARRYGASAAAIPIVVRGAHEYLYRIYLEHFQTPSFAICRLLDLLISASRLDTQSSKVLLFCRLMRLPGTDPLPPDSFWFLLKAIHILQRACIGSGNYFLLDANGVNEFVPQASAWEALSQLFYNSGSEVMKRLRMRLSGLASVYGAVWIPAYNIMEFVVEEWISGQTTMRAQLEELMLKHNQITCAADGSDASTTRLLTLAEFRTMFETLNLRVSRTDTAQAYRQLLSNATTQPSEQVAPSSGNPPFDTEKFTEQWLALMLSAINRAQHQQLQPPQAYTGIKAVVESTGSSASGSVGATVNFGAPCETLVAANQGLSRRFLKATWEQTKSDFIRWLDLEFHDIGLQVRLIQQMDLVSESTDMPIHQAWRAFQQLIQIVALGSPDS